MATTDSAYQMMTCPYNVAHQVERYRFQYHIEKCRKQHPKSSFKSCPFDASHVVPDGEMDFHITNCPKRGMFDRMKYNVDNGVEYRPSAPETSVQVESEENWENSNYSTYQPDTSKKIIRKVIGLTPAERRKARKQAIRDYNSTDNNAADNN